MITQAIYNYEEKFEDTELPKYNKILLTENTLNGITSLEELYRNKHRNYNPFLEKLKSVLEDLNNIEIDPVKYLYYLYYEVKLSTTEIYDLLYKIGEYDNKDKSTFEYMFKKTFGWKLRGNTEPSKNTKAKQSKNNGNKGKLGPSLIEINKKRKDLEVSEIEILYSQINVKGKTDALLLIDLENKKSLNQKVIYILYSLGFLKKENDEELANFIKKFQDRDIGFLKTAQIVRGLILKIKPELDKEIDEENLKKRLRERYNKYHNKK